VSTRGRFLVFEGIDGCGKTTQARRVAERLGAVLTFEPGDTDAGAALRAVVLDRDVPMTPLAEVLVMAADRAQHVAEVVEPALASGRDVVCDRYSGSTLAYQGHGRGLDLDEIRAVLGVATGGLVPDLTVLLDCPVEVAAARRGDAGSDRFEGAAGGFLDRVRDGFLDLAHDEGWAVIDATVALGAVDAAVDAAVDVVRP
jgi:dTMP kinase